MTRWPSALKLMEHVRVANAAQLAARYGITVDDGVPTTVQDGIHIAAATGDDLATTRRLHAGPGNLVLVRHVVAPERLAVFETVESLLHIHRNDVSIPNGFLPSEGPRAFDFGEVFMVKAGMAVGNLLLFDSRGTPGEPYDLTRVPWFDTACNVWVAHRHRRRGIASELLAHARERYPLVHLMHPFTSAGAGWIRACAPDMVDVGRNSPCPCRSGTKWKRCCGRAAA